MRLSISGTCRSLLPLATLAIAANLGVMHAAVLLSANPSSITLSCDTFTGLGPPATVLIQALASPAVPITVSVATLSGGVQVTAPQNQVLTAANNTTGLTYTFQFARGCVGATTSAAATQVIQFRVGTSTVSNDVTVPATATVSTTATPLVPTPNPITLTCIKNGSIYTPGPPQTISVTSAATPNGTAFKIDNTPANLPTWLTILPTPPGNFSAATNPATFTIAASPTCGSFALNSIHSATLHLLNSPAPDKPLPVTIQIVPPTPLTYSPLSPSLSYVKNSNTLGSVDVNINSTAQPPPFFTVDISSLPIWLTASSATGTTPSTLRFTSTPFADTLAPGTYSATVRLKVTGSADLPVPMSLLVTNPAPVLNIAGSSNQPLNWTVGQPIPTTVVTIVSSDSPINYTTSTSGVLAPQVAANQRTGLAYNYGTLLPVSFDPAAFTTAQPGATLTGSLTIAWGNPVSSLVVTFSVMVVPAPAVVNSITPAYLPTASAGTFYMVLNGSGFISNIDPNQRTVVGVMSGGAIQVNNNISVNIVNSSSIILTVSVPSPSDSALPFSPVGPGGTVNLGICNPLSGPCTTPTGTATFNITNNPIVFAATSASSFQQVSPPQNPTFAPYDLVSLFGANFCSSAATGCLSNGIMAGSPDPVTMRYPASLSPDPSSSSQRFTKVTFQTHNANPVVIADAPLLFSSDSQMNLVVPAGVASYVGIGTVDIVVSFGYGTGLTLLKSAPFPVNIQATNPGLFTVGANGQGNGAILASNYSLVSFNHEAGMRSTQTDSDVVQIYMTGLGLPDSTADNTQAGAGAAWSADCISATAPSISYLAALNSQTSSALTSLEGTVIQSSIINANRLPPCLTSSSKNKPSVTFGGVPGVVKYAGWVSDSIAGLYQVNAQIPSRAGSFTDSQGAQLVNIVSPVQLPVVITANGVRSQAGVNMWVTPRLKVLAPSAPAGLTGTVGVAWNGGSGTNAAVAASQGTSPYHYALTSGTLPLGLNLDANTGTISGTPAVNTAAWYTVAVTATDSTPVNPITGTVTFTIVIQGGLMMAASTLANGVFGTPTTLAQVTASGGLDPSTYSLLMTPLPVGFQVDQSGNLFSSDTTPAGTYHATVHAVDASGWTGNATFDVTVNLLVTATQTNFTLGATGGTIASVATTGNTSSVSYLLDATSNTNGFRISPAGLLTISATSAAALVSPGNSQSFTITVVANDAGKALGAAVAGTGSTQVQVNITNP